MERIHFFIEKKDGCFIASKCYLLGSDKPKVRTKYKKFVKVGYMPYIDENALSIQKNSLDELEQYLLETYSNYRCVFHKSCFL